MPLRTRSKTRSPASSSSGSSSNQDGRRALPGRAAKKTADKENVKNAAEIAFQPPSPLTSRRKSAQKSAKKVLSPNRNSQWNSASRLRSSPIHHAGYQDRDHRDASRSHASAPANLKREMSYTLSNDLDLIGKTPEDDFGPLISDCLNLGSFAEDSPPRGESKTYRRGASPPPSYRYGGYRTSPRAAAPPYQQQPPYYSAPPAQQGYSSYPGGYHPPPYGGDQAPPWASPRPYEYEHPPAARTPKEPYGRAISPPSKKSRRWEGTPEKKNTRSPFRSPMSNPGSAKKFKKSPIWGGPGTPSIGMYGSFGMMDTPGAHHLDAFSPMGPSFASFENDSPPLPLEGEILDARLSLVAGDRRVPPPSIQQRRTGRLESPGGFNFMNEMARMPGTSNVPSSPVRTSKRDSRERDGRERDHRERENPRYYDKDSNRRDRPPPERPPPPQMPLHQAPPPRRPSPPSTGGSKRTILTSPLAPSSHHGSGGRRATWYDSRQTPGPYRLELGDNFAKPSVTRRGLEGINNMMRGTPNPHRSAPPPLNHPGAYEQRGAPYRDMNTPAKMGGSAPPQQGRMPSSQPRGHAPQPYPGPSSIAPRQSGIPASASRYPQPSPAPHHPSSAQRPSQPPASTKIAGTPAEKAPAGQRRNPCNCKKSKCLKLYCECFAGEMYCDGCNCNDCRNNKTHEDVRSKAMKDTRAKNPNAFKPRIAQRAQVGPSGSPPSAHNMGCKCKRSECLKKYCECFQAGVMCGNKCKCVDCLNYPGSQALIDKRRKIKDHRGADFAMRIADEAWKGKHGAPAARSAPPPGPRHPAPAAAPARPPRSSHGQHMPPGPPHPRPTPPGPQHHSHPPRGPPPGGSQGPYMSHHPPMGHPPGAYAGYRMHPQSHHGSNKNPNSIRGGHPHHPSDSRAPQKPLPRSEAHSKPSAQRPASRSGHVVVPTRVKMEDVSEDSASKQPSAPDDSIKTSRGAATPSAASKPDTKSTQAVATPVAKSTEQKVAVKLEDMETSETPLQTTKPQVAPRTPGVRLGYDPSSSKKKRQLSPGQNEATFPHFGDMPEQPKTTALAVFSFLSNDEIYNAALVSKRWNRLAMDEELWQF